MIRGLIGVLGGVQVKSNELFFALMSTHNHKGYQERTRLAPRCSPRTFLSPLECWSKGFFLGIHHIHYIPCQCFFIITKLDKHCTHASFKMIIRENHRIIHFRLLVTNKLMYFSRRFFNYHGRWPLYCPHWYSVHMHVKPILNKVICMCLPLFPSCY